MESESIILGRREGTKSVLGERYLMLIGEEMFTKKKILADCAASHVIFVCGVRGSGKSYTLGVIAEELARNNPNVAVLIIDPLGVFWSIKNPNRESEELEKLREYGLAPSGFDSRVFIPCGLKESIPKNTYDATFSISVSDLTVDDWCYLFDFKRFSPQALLLSRALKALSSRFFTIDELIEACERAYKNSGFKEDTFNALISKIESAKDWGFLEREGTSLLEICEEGRISVIDCSFLSESLYSLITGIFARKILAARKLAVRTQGEEIKSEEVLLPPTWLIIDEAHTLVPAVKKTVASDALIEYVKQGRRPGCSLVFATQQPSAVDAKLLSQVDMIICHRLNFEEDIRAVMKRFPSRVPEEMKKGSVFRKLNPGECVIGERTLEECVLARIRARMSMHEGRDILATGKKKPSKQKLFSLLKQVILSKRMKEEHAKQIIKIVERKYGIEFSESERKNLLKLAPKVRQEEKLSREKKAKRKIKGIRADYERARRIAEKMLKKKFILFGERERIVREERVLAPVWRVIVKRKVKKNVKERLVLYVDDVTGKVLNVKGTPQIDEIEKLKKIKPVPLREEEIEDAKEKIKPRLSKKRIQKHLSFLGEIESVEKTYREIYRFVLKLGERERSIEIDEVE